MSKYEEFDAILIDHISRGFNTMAKLESLSAIKSAAAPHQTQQRWGTKPVFRVIDNRLQALRKGGKIVHRVGKWNIVGGHL